VRIFGEIVPFEGHGDWGPVTSGDVFESWRVLPHVFNRDED